MAIMLGSNVVLDLTDEDPKWMEWSKAQLETHYAESFVVNPMIYAEICCNFQNTWEVDSLLVTMNATLAEIPREALLPRSEITPTLSGNAEALGLLDSLIFSSALTPP